MFGGLAFMVNGHMCCGIIGENLVHNRDPLPSDFDQAGRPQFIEGVGYCSRYTSSQCSVEISRSFHYLRLRAKAEMPGSRSIP